MVGKLFWSENLLVGKIIWSKKIWVRMFLSDLFYQKKFLNGIFLHFLIVGSKQGCIPNINFWKFLNPITVGSLGPGSHDPLFLTPSGSKLNADPFWLFLNIPIDEFRTIKLVGKNFDLRGKKIPRFCLRRSGSLRPPPTVNVDQNPQPW